MVFHKEQNMEQKNKLSEALVKDGITSAAIHGNKSQGARTKHWMMILGWK